MRSLLCLLTLIPTVVAWSCSEQPKWDCQACAKLSSWKGGCSFCPKDGSCHAYGSWSNPCSSSENVHGNGDPDKCKRLGGPNQDEKTSSGFPLGPVMSQGDCGSCYTFAAAIVHQMRTNKALGTSYIMSPQSMLSCNTGYDPPHELYMASFFGWTKYHHDQLAFPYGTSTSYRPGAVAPGKCVSSKARRQVATCQLPNGDKCPANDKYLQNCQYACRRFSSCSAIEWNIGDNLCTLLHDDFKPGSWKMEKIGGEEFYMPSEGVKTGPNVNGVQGSCFLRQPEEKLKGAMSFLHKNFDEGKWTTNTKGRGCNGGAAIRMFDWMYSSGGSQLPHKPGLPTCYYNNDQHGNYPACATGQAPYLNHGTKDDFTGNWFTNEGTRTANNRKSCAAYTSMSMFPNKCDEVADAAKKNCGSDDTTPEQCIANGCCHRSSSVDGVPECFYENDDKCGLIADNQKSDCGYDQISPQTCRNSGCCFRADSDAAYGDGKFKRHNSNGSPTCFHKQAKPGLETTGDCQVVGNCVMSANYPENYNNNAQCTIKAKWPGKLTFDSNFLTEPCCDGVTIRGKMHKGGTIPPPYHLDKDETFTFTSDYSETRRGFKACLTEDAQEPGCFSLDWTGNFPASKDVIKQELDTNGPVSVVLNADYIFSNLPFWKLSGAPKRVFRASDCSDLSNPDKKWKCTWPNHAVAIVDHGTTTAADPMGGPPEGGMDYWKVRNSWKTDFGDKGYFYVEAGVNALGIESQVCFPGSINGEASTGHRRGALVDWRAKLQEQEEQGVVPTGGWHHHPEGVDSSHCSDVTGQLLEHNNGKTGGTDAIHKVKGCFQQVVAGKKYYLRVDTTTESARRAGSQDTDHHEAIVHHDLDGNVHVQHHYRNGVDQTAGSTSVSYTVIFLAAGAVALIALVALSTFYYTRSTGTVVVDSDKITFHEATDAGAVESTQANTISEAGLRQRSGSTEVVEVVQA